MSAERINWQSLPKRPERNTPDDMETSMSEGIILDVNKLIHLTERNPVLKVPVEQFFKRLEIDCWKDAEGNTFTPRKLIALIKELGVEQTEQIYPQYKRHIQKIQNADYSFPLHIYKDWVINGTHRLSKLVLEREMKMSNQDFITVKVLKEIPPESIIQ